MPAGAARDLVQLITGAGERWPVWCLACGHEEIETIIRSSFDEVRAAFYPIHGGYVPVGTAFHERTLALCESLNYREWSGYYTVGVYEMTHEHEYNAIRNSAALIDISPLFKYRVTGGGARTFVDMGVERDANKLGAGREL